MNLCKYQVSELSTVVRQRNNSTVFTERLSTVTADVQQQWCSATDEQTSLTRLFWFTFYKGKSLGRYFVGVVYHRK